MTEQINMFIPITKVNEQRREVWGWAAIEEPDNSDEILDYETSKPHFLDWSNRAQKRSGGKSLGNVRSMHQNVAAGKLIELRPDDVSKGFYVGAKIIDDGEWKKVESGVYTGFSVGGSYLKRWQDFRNPGKMRYTARPTELSIVDSPCIPSATFEMLKADGMSVKKRFAPSDGKNLIKVVTSERLIKVEWDESKHPRADDGKFGSGGGGGGGKAEDDDWESDDETLKEGEDQYISASEMKRQLQADKNPPRPEPGYGPRYQGSGKPSQAKQAQPDKQAPASVGGKKELDEFVSQNRNIDNREKPPNEWGSAKYSDPQATARQQRHSLFDERDQDGKKVIMRNKKTGDAFAISVREARNALFDEPQDEESRWHIYDAGDSAEAEGLWKPGESKEEYRGRVKQQVSDVRNADTMPSMRPERKIAKGDVMSKLERIYDILDDIEEELKKADIPDSPEPISDIPLKGEHGSYDVEQMPAPNVLMELEANSEPSQEVLASHTVKSEDLTKAFEAWLPKVGKLVKSTVAEALAEAMVDLEKSAPARIIKVKKNNLKE
jgi:hypothetical protein